MIQLSVSAQNPSSTPMISFHQPLTIHAQQIHAIGRLHHGEKVIQERHRHRYEVNPDYIERIEAKGLKFVAKDEMGVRMIIIENKSMALFGL